MSDSDRDRRQQILDEIVQLGFCYIASQPARVPPEHDAPGRGYRVNAHTS